jgi:hypothetical protein
MGHGLVERLPSRRDVRPWHPPRQIERWIAESQDDSNVAAAFAHLAGFWARNVSEQIYQEHTARFRSFKPWVVTFDQDGRANVIRELDLLGIEARHDNWDGYGAGAITWAALTVAKRFLEALPAHFPDPDISADPDGEVAFEWYLKPKYVLSVSVGQDGSLNYAASFGRNKVHGLEHFAKGIPKLIVEHLERLCSEAP